MKLINEKGKLFGLINVVDLIIVVMVIAMVGAVATMILGDQVTQAVSPQVEATAEIEIIGAAPRLYNEVERQALEGEKMVSGNTYLDAYIEEVWLEDYVVQAVTADGTIVDALDPTKKNIVFKMKFNCAQDAASPKVGSQEVRAGRTFIVKTQTFECSGTIRYVDIAEE